MVTFLIIKWFDFYSRVASLFQAKQTKIMGVNLVHNITTHSAILIVSLQHQMQIFPHKKFLMGNNSSDDQDRLNTFFDESTASFPRSSAYFVRQAPVRANEGP